MRPLTLAAATLALATPMMAQEVNVYSARHYDSDDALYDKFTEETGIKVNRIEAKADELIARMEAEGQNSPADVFIAVDVGRMARAEEAGLLKAYNSDEIEARVPEHLQHPDNLWFGLSQRARIIFLRQSQSRNAAANLRRTGRSCVERQNLPFVPLQTSTTSRCWPR